MRCPRLRLISPALLLLAPLAAGPAQVAPAGPVVTVPARIPADCSVDVTAELSAWIAAVPNDTTLTFPAGACYRIDDSLRLTDRWGLVFDGNGATLRAVADTPALAQRRHIWVSGGGRLVFRNLTIRGANPRAGTAEEAYRADREFQHAFALQGVSDVRLERVAAYDVYGDFVYVGPDIGRGRTFRWSQRVTISDATFARNGRQGIAVVAGEDVLITRVSIRDVRRAVFNMEPTGDRWGARRVRITGNTTGRSRLLWFSSYGRGYDVDDITITGNTMQEPSGVPVIFVVAPPGGRRGRFVIEDNTFIVTGSPAPGFRFTRVGHVTMRGNRATFAEGRRMTAVRLIDVPEAVIQNNRFCGAAQAVEADASSRAGVSGTVTQCR